MEGNSGIASGAICHHLGKGPFSSNVQFHIFPNLIKRLKKFTDAFMLFKLTNVQKLRSVCESLFPQCDLVRRQGVWKNLCARIGKKTAFMIKICKKL